MEDKARLIEELKNDSKYYIEMVLTIAKRLFRLWVRRVYLLENPAEAEKERIHKLQEKVEK